MRIALDYDGTYTADPVFWDCVVALAAQHGHEITIVSMRHLHEPLEVAGCEVIYTGRRAKVPHMEELGQKVDIWIDDSPHWLLSNAGDYFPTEED